jgi:hypothetical protein
MMQAAYDVVHVCMWLISEITNISEITQFISTCGFPIACTVFLLRQSFRNDDAQRKQFEDMRKTLDGNTRALNGLTKIVEDLKRSFE